MSGLFFLDNPSRINCTAANCEIAEFFYSTTIDNDMQESRGTNSSERYLANLCHRTFLDLWSHPNVHRDEKRGDKVIANEICDLLAVCGNSVIIFSDKSCELGTTGDPEVNWRRWYTKAITKSVKQIYGAERWLRAHPDRVFLDRNCKQRLSLLPADPRTIKFHRIAVAVGARDACKSFYGGSGSLIIEGGSHTNVDSISDIPYAVKQMNFGGGFVHVLDEVALDIVLGELSTITELIEYLSKKEALFQSKSMVICTGEEELLAYYFRSYNKDKGGYGFHIPDDVTGLSLQEGLWDQLRQHPQYLARKEADRISYIWDNLINDVATHARSGTLIDGSASEMTDTEKILRIMATESRASRRGLVRALLGILEAPNKNTVNTRSLLSFQDATTAYVFQSHLERASGIIEAEYRRRRISFLHAYCMAFALKHENVARIVGIATEAGTNNSGRSHDLIFVDARDRDAEFVAEATRLQSIFGVCREENLIMQHYHDSDFPEASNSRVGKMSQGSRDRAKYKARRKRSR